VIRVEGVRKRFPGATDDTLRDVSFTLEEGRLAAILGASGSGKSTLLRCIVGLERPDAGSIHLGGQAGLVFQSFELFPHLTALGNCTLAPRLEAYPEQLSGGQRQRVAIARALTLEPAVLLYDEPTSALDPSLRREVVETLRRVRSLGMTQLVVTHDVQLARASELVLVLDHGLLVEQGPPEQVLDAPRHDATRRLLSQTRE
jgi:ABC-type polar amino acid transport system ATPase subunit